MLRVPEEAELRGLDDVEVQWPAYPESSVHGVSDAVDGQVTPEPATS